MAPIAIGDKVPSLELDLGFPPKKVNVVEKVAGKKVIILGLPGAFTPTWSTRQIPGYLESEGALKAAGVESVLVYCVNDGAVMTAWGKDQKVGEESMIELYGDPTGAFTKACDMELTADDPIGDGLIGRCKRFAMYVVDGVVKFVAVAENEFDPAGDEFPEATLAPALLEAIKEVK